jgi:23S rRNA (uracil1939-C5)-methyltransferase
VLKYGDEIDVLVDSIAFEGKSVARVDGLVVFINGGIPGDRVRARVIRSRRRFLEADVVEVFERSLLRTEPRCVHFGTCGGCRWQNV